MRQLVSLVKDGQVRYAVVDDDDDTFAPFAIVNVPDRFDIHDAAELGTNLARAVGLNGRKPVPKQRPRSEPEAPTVVVQAKPKPPARRPSGRALPDPKNKVQWFIHQDDVLQIVRRNPEGLTAKAIAQELWTDGGHDGDVQRWLHRTVENRLQYFHERERVANEPLPFEVRYVAKIGKNGQPTTLQTKLYRALGGGTDG